jgi:nucleoid-associated protein YgaU
VQALGESGRLPQPGNVVIDTVGYNAEGAVALGGRSTAVGAELQIYLDNQPILRTRPAEDGTWQAQLDGIERGTYRLRVDELDAAAQVTSRAEIPFQRVTPEIAREASGPQALIVQPGNTLWAMSRDQFGAGERFMRIFNANRDQIRDPDLIFPGQVFVLPTE